MAREYEEKNYNRINHEIDAPQVRLVGENIEPGVYDTKQAIRMAVEKEADLVEISRVEVPVCRIIEYSKFLYEQKKRQKDMKAKAVKQVMKEIRFGPNTNEHDFDFKLKHAIRFLEEGSKVKAFVHFRGRSIIHAERGEVLLLRFIQELQDYGKIDQMPKLEGKRMFVFITPKGKKG